MSNLVEGYHTNKFCFLLGAALIALLSGCGDSHKNPSPQNIASAKVPDIKITKWGPQSTIAGSPFNVQPNGQSALWFQMSGSVQPGTMEIWLGDKKIEGLSIVSDQGGSALLPASLYAAPGKYQLFLLHTPSKTKIDIGTFDVLPRATDVPSIKIVKWGPQSTKVGQAFNIQPGGVSAIWFEMSGAVVPETMEA